MIKDLVKIWEREYTLHRMAGVLRSLSSAFARKHQDFVVTKAAAIHLPNGNESLWANPQQWQKYGDFIARVFYSQQRFKKFLRLYQQTKIDLLHSSTAARKAVEKSAPLEPNDLARLYNRFFKADEEFMVIGQWWAFYLAETADQAMQKLSQDREFLDAVLSPEKMSSIRSERQHLLQMYLAPKGRQGAMLADHVKKFNWIPCINVFNPPPWDEKFFRKQLKTIKSRLAAKRELAELGALSKNNHSAFIKVRSKQPVKQRYLLDHAHTMAFLKDDRDDTRRQAYYNARVLYQRIAAVLRIDEQDMLYFTGLEILQALKTNSSLSTKILDQRKKGLAAFLHGDRIKVVTGKEYLAIMAAIGQQTVKEQQVKGTVAFPGVVRGTARITPSALVLDKVKRGDILITVVTHPDYLPAMRRARAIVTDEGGLTSHAAIVARELKVPCVVGTKHATSVFKDGDLLEVDAKKGIIRKL